MVTEVVIKREAEVEAENPLVNVLIVGVRIIQLIFAGIFMASLQLIRPTFRRTKILHSLLHLLQPLE